MADSILVDTWGWLTLNDAGERQHQTVAALYHALFTAKTQFYTTAFILDETFTLLFKRLRVYQAQQAMSFLTIVL